MKVRFVLLAAVCAVGLAGCTSSVAGTARAGGPAASDDSTGGTGSGGIPPAPPRAAAIIETHRLGASVVDARRLLPDVEYTCIPDGPYPTSKGAAGIVFGSDTQGILDRSGYVASWINCFHTQQQARSAVLGLIETRDEDGAKQLVTRLALGSVHPGAKPITLDGLPKATVVQYDNYDKNPVVIGMVTTGRIVSYAYGDTKGGGSAQLPAVRSMITKLLKAQIAAAKSFDPTPTDKLDRLDDDPQLMDAKTYQPTGNPTWFAGGYSPRTYPAVALDRAAEATLLGGNGFTEYYRKDGIDDNGKELAMSLYQLRDRAAAKRVFLGEQRLAQAANPKRLRMVLAGSTDTYCYGVPIGTGSYASVHQQCLLTAGRYVIQADTAGVTKRASDTTSIRSLIHQQLELTPR